MIEYERQRRLEKRDEINARRRERDEKRKEKNTYNK